MKKAFGFEIHREGSSARCVPIDPIIADPRGLKAVAHMEGLELEREEKGVLFFKEGAQEECKPVKLTDKDMTIIVSILMFAELLIGAGLIIAS